MSKISAELKQQVVELISMQLELEAMNTSVAQKRIKLYLELEKQHLPASVDLLELAFGSDEEYKNN